MTDVAEIARGLTAAQRAVLLGLIVPWTPLSYRAVKAHLTRNGLAMPGGSRELTPLGLQVRNHLINGGTDV